MLCRYWIVILLACPVACRAVANHEIVDLLTTSRADDLDRAQALINDREPDELVPPLVRAVEEDPRFEQREARRWAYWALFSIGDNEPNEILHFTHPEQARMFIKVIRERDDAGLSLALQRVHLLDPEYHEEAVDSLIPLLESDRPSDVTDAARALGNIGQPARLALPRLRELLVDLEEANPVLWENMQRPAAQGDPEDFPEPTRNAMIPGARLRALAAWARVQIAPETLFEDLELYERSAALERAGHETLFTLAMYGELMTMDDATLKRAAAFSARFASKTTDENVRYRAIYVIRRVLDSPEVSDEIKGVWRTRTAEAAMEAATRETRDALLHVVPEPQP